MTFGEKLARARKARRLSCEQLSAQLGVTSQTISAWERGGSLPDTKTLLLLRDALGVSLDDLLSPGPSGWRIPIGEQQSAAFGRDAKIDAQEEPDEDIRLSCIYTDFAEEVRAALPQGAAPWSLILDRTQEQEQLQLQKMAMVLDAFLRTDDIGFGNVHLVILNDPNGAEVSWARTDDGYVIHLCAKSGWHWCQTAYQLGYAMMHCLIDHAARGPAILWAEELICEAAALELLYRLQQCWARTPFGKEDPEYADCLGKYIQNALEDKGTSALLRCRDRAELSRISSRNAFSDRLDESHDLFRYISGSDLACLAQMRKYAADPLLLHTHFWRFQADGSGAVDYLCRIQERIPGCDVPAGISQEVNLMDSKPSEQQLCSFAAMIRGLRDLPLEHIVFLFLDPDKEDCEQLGLVFYQLVREEKGGIVSEIRLDTAAGRKMYRLKCDEDRAISTLNEIILMEGIPDLKDWVEITDTVF